MAGDLLERDRELAQLQAAVRRAAAGDGAIAVVEGPAGIGKSALLAAAAEGAAGTVLRARAGAGEGEIPFEVVRSLLLRRVARGPDRDALLGGPAAIAAPILGLAGDGTVEPSAALHALHWLVLELAEREPLVLVVDDAHWADEPSLRFLAYLARRLDGAAVALLLGVRAQAASPRAAGLLAEVSAVPGAIRLVPAGLSDAAAATLVQRALGPDPPAEVARLATELAGGNPFLLGELLHAAASGADLRDAVGDRLASAVDRRLRELPAAARPVAEAVALLDSAAEVAVVSAVAQVPEAEVVERLDELAAARLLAPGLPARPAHPLLGEAILARIGPAALAAAHARAAGALHALGADPERVASHLTSAPPAANAATVEVLRAAAASSAARGAPDIGARFLDRALAEPPPPDLRVSVLTELGALATRVGRADGIARLLEAFDSTDDLGRHVILMGHIGIHASFAGSDAAERPAEQLLARLGDIDGEHPGLACSLTLFRLAAGNPLDAQLLDRLARSATDDAFARGVHAAVRAFQGAPAAEVRAAALATIDDDGRFADLLRSGRPLTFVYDALALVGMLDTRLAARFGPMADSARARGAHMGLAVVQASAASVSLRRGRVTDALEVASAAVETTRRTGLKGLECLAASVQASAHVLRGELDSAQALLGALPADVPERGFHGLHAATARLDLAQARGATTDALLAARRLQALCEAAGYDGTVTGWRASLARAHAAEGSHGEAAALAAEDLAAARRIGAPNLLARALVTAALCGGDAADLLEEALDALDGADLPLDRALVLLHLGAGRRRAGDRRAARGPLGEALDLADRCGALAVAQRARDELLASGARPRRSRQWGLDALTPSELRVARLAARGLTNREIAAELFVTPKTVEVHLGRCYRKLDVDGRDALPGVV